MIVTLDNYIEKMKDSYKKARPDYIKAAERLERITSEHNNLISSGDLSQKGIIRENERFKEQETSLKNEIETIRQNFINDCNKVKTNVNNTFKDKYVLNKDLIDNNALELLKAGIMNNAEIVDMAKEYKANDNYTMTRLVGSFINNPETTEEHYFKNNSKGNYSKREDLKAVDQYATLCLKGLQDDIKKANSIDKDLDNLDMEVREVSKRVSIEKADIVKDYL